MKSRAKAPTKVRGSEPPSQQGAAALNQILTTSIELFSEQGFAATTMRQLADRAGMPISAYYYYYRSKYDVLLAIIEIGHSEGDERIRAVVDPDLPADQQLGRLVEAHVAYHLESPLVARVADRELRALKGPDLQRVLRRRHAYEQPFVAAIKRGMEEGSFPRDLDVTIAKNLIITMSTGVIDWWRPKGDYSAEQVAALISDYAVRIAAGPLSTR